MAAATRRQDSVAPVVTPTPRAVALDSEIVPMAWPGSSGATADVGRLSEPNAKAAKRSCVALELRYDTDGLAWVVGCNRGRDARTFASNGWQLLLLSLGGQQEACGIMRRWNSASVVLFVIERHAQQTPAARLQIGGMHRCDKGATKERSTICHACAIGDAATASGTTKRESRILKVDLIMNRLTV